MDAALATMVANLESKTGRSLDEWLEVVRRSGIEKHGEVVKMLKSEHGMTHGYANLVAHASRGGLEPASDPTAQQEEALFAGKKVGLRPVYDAVRHALVGLGADVALAPKQAYVSFLRQKQFAVVQPSTATRLDVGLNLNGVEATGRLESAAGFNAMCTHRIRLTSAAEVDAEVREWLRTAYERAG